MGRDFTPVHLHFYADDRRIYFVHPCWNHWQLQNLPAVVTLEGTVTENVSEIFTIKPHVWAKNKKKKMKTGV